MWQWDLGIEIFAAKQIDHLGGLSDKHSNTGTAGRSDKPASFEMNHGGRKKRRTILGASASFVLETHFAKPDASDSDSSGEEAQDVRAAAPAADHSPRHAYAPDSDRGDFDDDADIARGGGSSGAEIDADGANSAHQHPSRAQDDTDDEEIALDGDESDAHPDPFALLGSDNEDGPQAHSDAANVGAPETVQIAGAPVGTARDTCLPALFRLLTCLGFS